MANGQIVSDQEALAAVDSLGRGFGSMDDATRFARSRSEATDLTGIRRRSGRVLEEYEAPIGDALMASAEDAFTYSPSSSLVRIAVLERAKAGESPLLPAEDARAMVAESGLELEIPDTGIRARALEIIMERKRDEILRQDTLNRAPRGVFSGGLRFAAGLVGSMLDPLNVAASFIPVVGQTRYAAMLARQSTRIGRAGVRVRVGALEGAVGAALVEPIVLAAATQEQADYGLAESLLNIGFGTVLGAGLHTGAGAIADSIRLRGKVKREAAIARVAAEPVGTAAERAAAATPEVREAAMRTAVAQEAEGKQATVDHLFPEVEVEGIPPTLERTAADDMVDGAHKNAPRANAPENTRVADFEASEQAQAKIDEAATKEFDEDTARAEMAADVEQLQSELTELEMEIGTRLDDVDANLVDAEEFRDVLRAAAICHKRTG